MSEEDQVKKFKLYQKYLRQVKSVLEDDQQMSKVEALPLHMQIDEICKLASVKRRDFDNALKFSNHCFTIHYKRKPCEIFVNTYNKEWLKAWDGNMDMQICLDYYVVVTYITEYVTKIDNQLMNSLVKAVKENGGSSLVEMMKIVKDTFLSHRQLGEAVLFYQILPNLSLKDSNVKCIFR